MKKNLDKLNDIIIMYSNDLAIITLPNLFRINDFKDIFYNNKYLTFVNIEEEKKIVILSTDIIKKVNKYKNIYLMDLENYTEKVVVLKENNILIKE